MANTTEFYNAGQQITISFVGLSPSAGVSYNMPKRIFTYYKVNSEDFHVKAGEVGLMCKYSEVSTTNPPGHATLDQLFAIFQLWLDENTDADADHFDDLHRTRVVEPYNVFEFNFRHNTEPRKFNTLTVSGGTITFEQKEQYTELKVDTTADARALIQSKKYIPFQEGKSFQIQLSALLRSTLAVTDNSVQLGYFDDNNDKDPTADQSGSGVFINMDATGALSLVRRSYVGGTQTDTSVLQSAWNIDKLNGTGTSGFTLDPTKVNTYVFEIIMDSTCTIRFGVISGRGGIYYAHRFTFANTLTTGGIFNASLPVRMDLLNGPLGVVGATSRLFSGAVISEGSYDLDMGLHGNSYSVDNLVDVTKAVVLKSSGEAKPVLSIRLSKTKCRTVIHPLLFMLLNFKDNAFYKYRLVVNPTLAGTPTWVSTQLPSDSSVEYDLSQTTTYTAGTGTTIITGYSSSKSEKVSLVELKNRIELYSSIDGATTDVLTIVVEYINSDCSILGDIQWVEYN